MKVLKENLMLTQNFLGNSPEMKRMVDQVIKIASTSSRVLITGENGTGKELAAKQIHRLSERKNNAFIHVTALLFQKICLKLNFLAVLKAIFHFHPVIELANLKWPILEPYSLMKFQILTWIHRLNY